MQNCFQGKGRGRNKKKFTKKKSTPRTDGRVAKVNIKGDSCEISVFDSNLNPDSDLWFKNMRIRLDSDPYFSLQTVLIRIQKQIQILIRQQ